MTQRIPSLWLASMLACGCAHGRAESSVVIVAPVRCDSPPSVWAPHAASQASSDVGSTLMAAVTDAPHPELVLYDLATTRVTWRAAVATARTRPEILRDVVVLVVGDSLVGFDLRSGAERFRAALPEGEYLGAAQVGSRVAFVTSSPTWDPKTRHSTLSAVDVGTGARAFSRRVPELLGRPHAGRDAFLALADHRDLRAFEASSGNDAACTTLEDAAIVDGLSLQADGIFFGAAVTQRFDPTQTERDGLKPPEVGTAAALGLLASDYVAVPATRSAHGRVGWSAALGARESGQAVARADRLHFVFYRDLIAHRTDGSVAWARVLPHDIVRAHATEAELVVVLESGAWQALDATTGALRARGEVGSQLASASLEVHGSAQLAAATPEAAPDLQGALSAMALDTDARLLPARMLAVDALARIDGSEATRGLLAVARAPSAPRPLRQRVAEHLSARRDPEPFLDALNEHYDFLEAKSAPPLDLIVPALIAQGERRALPGLEAHLTDPATPLADLALCVRALAAVGGDSAKPVLTRFIAMYRADSALTGDAQALALASQAIAPPALPVQAPTPVPSVAMRTPAPEPTIAASATPTARSPRATAKPKPPVSFWAFAEARARPPLLIPRGDPWWRNLNPPFVSVEPVAVPREPAPSATENDALPAATPKAAATPPAPEDTPARPTAPAPSPAATDAWWTPVSP